MSNVLIGVNNLIDTSTISSSGGGGIVSTLPLDNLKIRQQGIVTRSISTVALTLRFALTSTKLIRVMGIFNHNLTLSALVSFRVYSDNAWTTQIYSSGSLSAFPDTFESGYATGWNDPTPGTPRPYTDDERAYTKQDYVHVLPTAVEGQSLQITLNDTTNPAGYVQLGRAFFGPAWQPTYNFDFGQNIGLEDISEIKYALDGTAYYNARKPLRVANFTLAHLSELEAMQSCYEIDRMCGTTKEVVYIYDPSDTYNILRRRFMGTLRKLSAIEQPEAYNNFSKTYEIKECI